MKKPMIAITTQINYETGDYLCRKDYVQKVIKAGGIPVLLPPCEDVGAVVECFDGFILSGGGDVAPQRYGEENWGSVNISKERDRFETDLAVHIFNSGKAQLAICRGIQVLNVVLGGTLFQDLPSQMPSTIDHQAGESAHRIDILDGSVLKNMLETTKLQVNSYHHQAVNKVATDLKIAALTEDGVIEGVYAPSQKFCLGVQWHPEKIENAFSDKLFSALIEAAAK